MSNQIFSRTTDAYPGDGDALRKNRYPILNRSKLKICNSWRKPIGRFLNQTSQVLNSNNHFFFSKIVVLLADHSANNLKILP